MTFPGAKARTIRHNTMTFTPITPEISRTFPYLPGRSPYRQGITDTSGPDRCPERFGLRSQDIPRRAVAANTDMHYRPRISNRQQPINPKPFQLPFRHSRPRPQKGFRPESPSRDADVRPQFAKYRPPAPTHCARWPSCREDMPSRLYPPRWPPVRTSSTALSWPADRRLSPYWPGYSRSRALRHGYAPVRPTGRPCAAPTAAIRKYRFRAPVRTGRGR